MNANEHNLTSLKTTAKAIQKTTNATKMYENANTTLTLLKSLSQFVGYRES